MYQYGIMLEKLMVLSMLLLAGVENLQAVIQAMVPLSDSRLPIPTLSMVKAPRCNHPLSPSNDLSGLPDH